jgi:ketosteroid isomerase-like protein
MSQENVERIRSAYDAVARRDIEALKALARDYPPAPGFEFDSVLTGQVYRGTQGILDLAADMWETVDYAPEPEEFIDAGDHVVAVLRISGRGARSGAPVAQRVGIVWTFEGETLVRGQSFTSRDEALEAVGLPE